MARAWWIGVVCLVGCGGASGGRAPDGMAPDGGDPFAGAATLSVPVPASGRVYVRLGEPALVAAPEAGNWDLAFAGFDVFTNSGPSGSGAGAAFGPLELTAFAEAAAPAVPFLEGDRAGGAFVEWYAYDGATHLLYSRFHVYGVRRDGRTWKLQVLGYYGLQNNAPTSAMFQVRWAELGGATQTLTVDGTAGGLGAPEDAPGGCLDLASGVVSQLTVAAAQASPAWDLCFRRDAISVNGEAGGPRGVGAVDLQAAASAGETLAAVKARTAASELARFDSVGAADLAAATWRGDHVVSVFATGGWLDAERQPVAQAWLVVEASGAHKFLIAFERFASPTTSSPGTVVMHIKPVSG
jgi:hypothetical protein